MKPLYKQKYSLEIQPHPELQQHSTQGGKMNFEAESIIIKKEEAVEWII